jgi:hypothetical protein
VNITAAAFFSKVLQCVQAFKIYWHSKKDDGLQQFGSEDCNLSLEEVQHSTSHFSKYQLLHAN